MKQMKREVLEIHVKTINQVKMKYKMKNKNKEHDKK